MWRIALWLWPTGSSPVHVYKFIISLLRWRKNPQNKKLASVQRTWNNNKLLFSSQINLETIETVLHLFQSRNLPGVWRYQNQYNQVEDCLESLVGRLLSVAVGLLLRRCATLAVGYIDSRRDFFWLQARDEPTGEEVRQLTASRFLRCVFHNNNNNREPTNQPTRRAVASRSRRAKWKQNNCATKEEKTNKTTSVVFYLLKWFCSVCLLFLIIRYWND